MAIEAKYDAAGCQARRVRVDIHIQYAAELALMIHQDRPPRPVTLRRRDVTDRMVAAWAAVRWFLAENVSHVRWCHPGGAQAIHIHQPNADTTDMGLVASLVRHTHTMPELPILMAQLMSGVAEVDEAGLARARRDLWGLVGLRVRFRRVKENGAEPVAPLDIRLSAAYDEG